MPASPEIREAIRQGSWIRKMFEDGAVLKAERGEENVFDFTLGNPYGEPPAALAAELSRLCSDPPPGLHRYMPNAGLPESRRAAARSLSRATGLPFTEDLLVMTVGAAGALNVALRAILSPGDEVAILAPYFVEYLFYIRNAGGVPVVAETDERFQLDLAAIGAALTPKTRAILINTPNNPTGAVYPEGDLAALDRLLSAAEERFGNPIYVISDEPYRKIVFRGVTSTPAAAKIRNTLVAYSHSKDLNLPGERIGYLAVYSRSEGEAQSGAALRELEELALRAGPAIDNARSFREARELADLDALTSLHNRRYFHETLAREVARAHRYQRGLALIVFDLDDFKAINDRIGHLAGDSVLAEAAERIRDVVRSADIACRVGGDEFAVILPESAASDADQLYKRLQAAVSSRPIGQAGRLKLSAGIAELKAEDDGVSFFERADEALYRAKDAGKGTAVASGEAESRAEWPRSAPGS